MYNYNIFIILRGGKNYEEKNYFIIKLCHHNVKLIKCIWCCWFDN